MLGDGHAGAEEEGGEGCWCAVGAWGEGEGGEGEGRGKEGG